LGVNYPLGIDFLGYMGLHVYLWALQDQINDHAR